VKKSHLCCLMASCAALLLWSASAPVTAQGQQALVIQGGTLIDGNGGAPVANSVVVIEGDRIAAVGAAGQVDVPDNARVIDAGGKWVLPGLVDAKANYNWPYGEAFIHYGVTSAMVSGPRGDQGIAERDAINHGIYEGPRLFQTVYGIAGPGDEPYDGSFTYMRSSLFARHATAAPILSPSPTATDRRNFSPPRCATRLMPALA